MRHYKEVRKRAMDIYYNREKYCYFYGAKGQIMTDPEMDALIAAEPDYFKRYTPEQLISIKNYNRGKTGYDCSGFTAVCTGDMQYSGGQFANCAAITTPRTGPEGSLLYKPGHVGLDIGSGYFLHFPTEGKTCELGKISEYAWVGSGQPKMVDYVGADAR